MGGVEGSEGQTDSDTGLGERVIHVSCEANKGTSQPKVAPHIRGGVDGPHPVQQGQKLLIHEAELDVYEECGCAFSARQVNLVI